MDNYGNNNQSSDDASDRIRTESANTTRILDKLGSYFKNQMSQATESIAEFLSASSGISFLISKTRDSISELKDLDSILTKISKTSGMTEQKLKELSVSAFDAAGRYGKTASDYLTTVQEMYDAGFQNAGQMSELSILAQAAGDLDADTANSYLMASSNAYELEGNIEALQKILDGQSHITDNAAVSMLTMAQATSTAADAASQYNVKAEELSALIATAASKTHESGEVTGASLASLFESLQNMSDSSVKEALESVNISMTQTVNGSRQLKTPVQLLKELSEAFANLGSADIRRTNILSDIGGDSNADTLSAILDNWQSYEEMLHLYSKGMGSAAAAAEKTANSWEGSLNRLSNTWTDTVGNLTDSDAVITAINSLNSLLSAVNKVTGWLKPLGTIGLGAGLFAGFQNVGEDKMYSSNSFCCE